MTRKSHVYVGLMMGCIFVVIGIVAALALPTLCGFGILCVILVVVIPYSTKAMPLAQAELCALTLKVNKTKVILHLIHRKALKGNRITL